MTLWWIVVRKSRILGSSLIECYRYVSMCLIPKKTCRFHLRNIRRIRKCIPQDISSVLIKSLVMSRLDYSNGLLHGLPKCTVSGLQAVQNSAARIVTQERLQDHDSMSRALMELHWLPVDKRMLIQHIPCPHPSSPHRS